MSLSLTVKYGEYILIGDTKVTPIKGNGNQVILNVVADKHISIKRQRLVEPLTNTIKENSVIIRRKIK